MRILIADDERLARFSLKSMLEEIGVPPRQIHMARDGREMVDVARQVVPDLAFVDVRMPRMDGLSGIEQARLASPGTRWVVLTSHSSFEYARRAIPLGVTEYLLKPVSPAELARVVDQASRDRRRDLERQNGEFEGRINSLLHGTLSLESDPVGFISTARFTGGLLLFDSMLDERGLSAKQRASYAEIRARMTAALEGSARMAPVTLPTGHIAMVCAWQPGGDPSVAESLQSLLRRIGSVLDSSAQPDARVTLVLCEESGSFDALLFRLSRAGELAALRVVRGIGRQLDLAEIEGGESAGRYGPLCAELEGVAQGFRERNRPAFLSCLENAERVLEKLDHAARNDIEGPVARYLAATVGLLAEGAPLGGETWRGGMHAIGDALHAEEGGAGNLAEQVLDFLNSHYIDDIGIGQIATLLGVTPNYLSSLFHRETGVTFVKYLTRLRMDRAREMLAVPGALVQDVARAVGYASVRHFSKLFQKQFGLHPSEAASVEKSASGS